MPSCLGELIGSSQHCALWALVVLGFACDSTAQSDPTPAECAVIDPGAPETDCGTYLENFDLPCGEPEASSEDECAQIAADNDAAVACILQADAGGSAYSFEHEVREISIVERSRYHVMADGTMWRENDDSLDQCTYTATRLYGEISLEACSGWECIFDQLSGTLVVATCEENESCP